MKENSSKLTTGLVALVVVVALILLLLRSKKTAELNASEQLAKANTELGRGELQQAIDILLNMNDNYSGTNSASKGVYMLGYSYYQKGDYDDARVNFKKYLDDYGDDPILASAAHSGIGACLEQQGKFIEAAQSYEQGASKFSKQFNAPQQLMDAARSYTRSNRLAEARRCYETLLEKHPDTNLKNDAELLLARIKG